MGVYSTDWVAYVLIVVHDAGGWLTAEACSEVPVVNQFLGPSLSSSNGIIITSLVGRATSASAQMPQAQGHPTIARTSNILHESDAREPLGNDGADARQGIAVSPPGR